MGGLSKKAFQYNKLRKETALPSLTLDAGGLLFSSPLVSTNLLDQGKITAEGIAESYSLMGYDGVGITGRDLAAGLDFLQDIEKKSTFSWLSANIISNKNGKPVFKPFITIEAGSQHAIIIGLTQGDPYSKKSVGPDNAIISWDSALPAVFSSIKDPGNFIVLLTDLPLETCKEITKNYPDINLIIRATGTGNNLAPELIAEKTLLTATGKQGKYIGAMKIDWENNTIWDTDPRKKLIEKHRELERLDWQINRYQNRPELLSRYRALEEQRVKIRTEVDALKHEIEKEPPTGIRKSTFSNQFIAIDKILPDDPKVLEVVNNIKLATSDRAKNGTEAGINNSFTAYTGWRKCGECHQSQLRTWQNSRHARAYLTLISKNQQFNRQCVFCHVTGMTKDAAANAPGLPPELQHVGCESCHGPGTAHANAPTDKKLLPVTAKTCAQCHVPDHDDDFNFKRDLDKLHCSTAIPEKS